MAVHLQKLSMTEPQCGTFCKVYQWAAAVPVSTCSVERGMGALQGLKTPDRNAMSGEK